MKKLAIAALGAATLFVLPFSAFAEDTTGVITNASWSTGTITLDNGDVYVVPEPLQGKIVLGTKVTISHDGKVVTAISKAT